MDNSKTRDDLKGLPFETVKKRNSAQEEIRLNVWKRLETGRVFAELVTRSEFEYWRKEFQEGLSWKDGPAGTDEVFKIFSPGTGVQVKLNKDLIEKIPIASPILDSMFKSLSAAFVTNYYKAKGILPPEDEKIVPDGVSKIGLQS